MLDMEEIAPKGRETHIHGAQGRKQRAEEPISIGSEPEEQAYLQKAGNPISMGQKAGRKGQSRNRRRHTR